MLLGASSLLVAVPEGEAHAAETGPPAGMVTDLTWYISRADMDRSVAMMKEAGVRWVRANVNWSSVEPTTKGSLDQWWLTELDYAVRAAQTAGIQVLMPIADGVPYWASADPQKYRDGAGNHWNRYWKPTNYQDYADFVKAIVTRYKGLGVHTYQVWNEPNYVRFWPSGPRADDYTAMLRAASPVIKQADPAARVVLGGLSLSDYTFLQQLYTAGAGPYFDIAAVHPYTGNVDPTVCWYQAGTLRYAKESFCAIEEVRKTMVANGDTKEVWLTELGWATASAPNGVSEATQADFLTKAFKKLGSYPYVTNAFWYSFRNNYWQNNDPNDVEANYGLVKVDFTKKLAYTAFKNYATATAVVPDTQAPVLSDIKATGIQPTSAVISWTTNEPANATVVYWLSGSILTKTVTSSRLATTRQLSLVGLQPGTRYSYKVKSTDAAGNRSVSTVLSFVTAP